MKNLKTKMALLLILIIVTSILSACDTSSKETETTGVNAETTMDSKTMNESESKDVKGGTDSELTGIDAWEPFAESVTITVPIFDRAVEGLPAVDDNYWTKWIQTEFGDKYSVTVDFVPIPRYEQMTTYSLLIAGGETPTIMMEYDYPKVAEWANTGAMQPYDLEAFAKVAPTYYNRMVELEQLQYAELNGETYFALAERPYYDTTYTFCTFIRKDWLDEVGLDIPSNYEEQKAAIQAIIDAGLTDIAPVGLTLPSDAQSRNIAFREFPVDEAEWAMNASLGTASLTWEPTYKMIKRLNDEYNAGWYSSEFELDVASDSQSSQWQTDFVNGKVYAYSGYLSPNIEWLSAFYENNPDAELALQSNYVVVEEGVVDQPQIRAFAPFGMIIGFSSLATEDELTAAWMYMEWMTQEEVLFTMQNGMEGVNFEYNEDGIAVANTDYKGEEQMGVNLNKDIWSITIESRKVGDSIEDEIAAIVPQGLPQDFTQAVIDNYYELRDIANHGWAYTDPIFSVDIAADSEYTATLLSMWQEDYAKLIKAGPDDFDSLYERLCKDYLDAGYQEILDERLAAYEAGKSTKLPE